MTGAHNWQPMGDEHDSAERCTRCGSWRHSEWDDETEDWCPVEIIGGGLRLICEKGIGFEYEYMTLRGAKDEEIGAWCVVEDPRSELAGFAEKLRLVRSYGREEEP